MTILERNQTRYVIEVKYSRWWLLVTAVCLCLGASLILNAATTTFTCQRVESDEGQCAMTMSSPLNTSTQSINLNRIKAAQLNSETTTDSKGRKTTWYHAVLILTVTGPYRIHDSTNSTDQHALVADINDFLTDPKKTTLMVTLDSPTDDIGVGVLIIAFGLWCASEQLKITTFTFDKGVGTLTIESRLIWTRLKTLRLGDILDIEIHETEAANKRTIRRVYIILRGQEIATPLPSNDEELILSLRLFLNKTRIP